MKKYQKYIEQSSELSYDMQDFKELLIEIGDLSNDGYKLSDRLNWKAQTNYQANLSGDLKQKFLEIQNTVDDLMADILDYYNN